MIEKTILLIALVLIVSSILFTFIMYVNGYFSLQELLPNIIAETLGIGMAILLINFMFSKMENRVWRKVRGSVFESIKSTIEEAYISIVNIFAYEMFYIPSETRNVRKFIEEKQLERIEKLVMLDENVLMNELAKLLKEHGSKTLIRINARGLVKCAEELSYLQQTYMRFLTPELATMLIRLRTSLRSLGKGIENYVAIKKRYESKITTLNEGSETLMRLELAYRLSLIAYYFKEVVPLLLQAKGIKFEDKV